MIAVGIAPVFSGGLSSVRACRSPGLVLLAFGVLGCMFTNSLNAQRLPQLADLQQRAIADSNDPMAHYQLAMGYWQKKKWDEAELALRQSTSLVPSFAEGWLALAVLPEKRGERYWRRFADQHGGGALDSVFAQATRHYRRAFLTDPLVDLAVLGRFKSPPSIISSGSSRTMLVIWWAGDFEKGVNALRESRNEEAYQRMNAILTDRRAGNDPQTIPWFILWHHGQAAARTGRSAEAIQDFAMLTGRARAQEGHEPDSLEQFMTRFTLFADNGLELLTNEFRYVLGLMYFLGGRLDEATAIFQRVLEFDLGAYQAHVQLARIYEARQQWAKAIAERRSAVATNPDDPSLLIDLGATLMRVGQLEEAVGVLEEATELAPRNPRATFTLGLAAAERQDVAASRRAFNRFLALAPSSDAYQIGEARRRLAELPAE